MTDTATAASGKGTRAAGAWAAVVLYVLVPAVIAALMLYYLLMCRRAAGEFGFPLDDSWIHMRFAQNLAAGHGFSFNPGEPTSTTTSPLWTLLFGLAYRVTREYVLTAAALNWLICVLTALTASALATTLVPRREFGAAVALVVAATIPLPWLALSGMEPPLFMWLSVLGILLHVRLRKTRGLRALSPTVVFGLAAVARPEGLLLFPLAMLDRLLVARCGGWGKPAAVTWLKQVATHTPVFLAMLVPVVAYNYSVIGRPLPSSYYIKAMNYGVVWALVMDNERLLLRSLLVAPVKELGSLLLLWAGNNAVLIIPFLLGSFVLLRQAGAPARAQHRSFLILLVLIVQPVAWAISTNFHRAPAFQGQRYVANLGPLYLVLGMAGGWWILQLVTRPGLRRVASLAGLCLVLIASAARQPACARLYAHNVKNITEMQVTTARWIRDNLPKESLLCANDVGAIGAITECRVLDTQGLVSPEILACLTIDRARSGAWRECWRQVIVREEPDYVVAVTRPERYQDAIRGFDFLKPKLIYREEIDDNITCGGPLIVVLQTALCKHPPKTPLSASAPVGGSSAE